MAKTNRKIPAHVLAPYEQKARTKIARGQWPLPCGQRNGTGIDQGEAWTQASKAACKRDVARARRRAGKAEAREG